MKQQTLGMNLRVRTYSNDTQIGQKSLHKAP
jgi:hypothetical protein